MGTIKICDKNKNKIMKKVNKLYQTTIDLRTPREKELKKEKIDLPSTLLHKGMHYKK